MPKKMTFNELMRFKLFDGLFIPPAWTKEEIKPPSEMVRERALKVCNILKKYDMEPKSMIPTPNSSILLKYIDGKFNLVVEIYRTKINTVSVCEPTRQQVHTSMVENFDFENIVNKFKKVADKHN